MPTETKPFVESNDVLDQPIGYSTVRNEMDTFSFAI